MAEQPAPAFELPEYRGAADRPEASAFGLDSALGLAGLPGLAGPSAGESTYEKAWRMSDGPGGTTRLTYGERYRRNPDGSYGVRSSSKWDSGNIADRLLEQALSAGSGWFSSWAEGWLGGYGKARLSVRINDEGDVAGSGDFLYPIYDSEFTTVFTQLGLRTMSGDRVIGNFGLGQRFFPAENFALGYNVFLDQDFSRNHTRGGAGVEAWYDWLRLSANYYTPLSGWKGSEDYDRRLVEERPAEGYDARLTGYLPFYRNLAVTGAFEKWKGDQVGAFGNDDFLHRNPKVWSYGLEWTPVPAFSTSINQRHSGGQKETQFGLTFNYHFGMDWEDQLSPAMVAEMRTVDGSRHDFVNRQNEIILEYREKSGANRASAGAISLTNLSAFNLTNKVYTSTASLTWNFEGLPAGTPVHWEVFSVDNSVLAAAPAQVWKRDVAAKNGLFWGGASAFGGLTTNNWSADAVLGSEPTGLTAQITDVVGSREVVVQASVCIGGTGGNLADCNNSGGTFYSEQATVPFDKGPLSLFGKFSAGNIAWANVDDITAAASYPAADFCDGTVNGDDSPTTPWPPAGNPNWSGPTTLGDYYAIGSKLPTMEELQAVSGYDSTKNDNGRGAALAAGWSVNYCLTGDVAAGGKHARVVGLADGYTDGVHSLNLSNYPVVCLR